MNYNAICHLALTKAAPQVRQALGGKFSMLCNLANNHRDLLDMIMLELHLDAQMLDVPLDIEPDTAKFMTRGQPTVTLRDVFQQAETLYDRYDHMHESYTVVEEEESEEIKRRKVESLNAAIAKHPEIFGREH